ncbi:MAG: hypothetical protein Q9160_000333 [Pyrenula sp. 1 TL-2023]
MKYNRDLRHEKRQQGNSSLAATTSQDTRADSPTNDTAAGPIFFWREFEEPYGFMCQWYTSYFTDSSVHPTHTFNCAEQYMMYRKALILATPDPDINISASADKERGRSKKSNRPSSSQRAKIALAQQDRARLPSMIIAEPKPGKQKELARSVKLTDSQIKIWESAKFDVVCQGTYCKFTQNLDLKKKLLATGERELVEASPTDGIWGIGFAVEFAEMHRQDWGRNLLGKALMRVRERVKVDEEENRQGGR